MKNKQLTPSVFVAECVLWQYKTKYYLQSECFEWLVRVPLLSHFRKELVRGRVHADTRYFLCFSFIHGMETTEKEEGESSVDWMRRH